MPALLRSFSALQRAENSSTATNRAAARSRSQVSVLFSEPKIPQHIDSLDKQELGEGFSALQRAENSSTRWKRASASATTEFQCSSASRKFLNAIWRSSATAASSVSVLFSEPKIPQRSGDLCGVELIERFQCSSASRKFLNFATALVVQIWNTQFQCSSASRKFLNRVPVSDCGCAVAVSVLFSEPKIPQPSTFRRRRRN